MQDDYSAKSDSLVSVTEDLNSRLVNGEKDFESTKQDFLVNDAAKNDKIATLESQLKDLQIGFDEVTSTLDNTKDLYKTTQGEKEKASGQLARMNSELVKLRQDTVSLNYALTLQQRKSATLQSSLDQQISKYTGDVSKYRADVTAAKKDVETSRLKTKELERQVTLKEKQITEINTAFVALRKDLLRAKSQGTPIDPNSNSSVSKLAKSLGQY